MRLLLDTHTLAWWLLDDRRLSGRCRELIGNPENEIFVSAVSAFETAIKHRLGKWPEIGPLADAFEELVIHQNFALIPISARHASRAGSVVGDHRDPFDRILAAQSVIEGWPLLSNDDRLGALGAETIW